MAVAFVAVVAKVPAELLKLPLTSVVETCLIQKYLLTPPPPTGSIYVVPTAIPNKVALPILSEVCENISVCE